MRGYLPLPPDRSLKTDAFFHFVQHMNIRKSLLFKLYFIALIRFFIAFGNKYIGLLCRSKRANSHQYRHHCHYGPSLQFTRIAHSVPFFCFLK